MQFPAHYRGAATETRRELRVGVTHTSVQVENI